MLSGDFATMGLADVLQWLDATRSAGVLTIERGSERVVLQVSERTVVRASEPSNRPVSLQALGHGPLALDPTELAAALVLEHLYDQFLASEGGFRFVPGVAVEDGVRLEIALAELLMESLRLLDEWPAIEAALPNELGRLEWLGIEPIAPSAIQRALIACAKQGLSLRAARFGLGLSRPALLRRVRELAIAGVVAVSGASTAQDANARLLEKARELLKQQQFDEAAHVFSALLASDPSASAVRNLLRSAEQQQLEWLRNEVPAQLVPRRVSDAPESKQLGAAEREVLARVNDRWDVAVLALVSPLRETETLKSLRKLCKLRLIELCPR